LHFSAQLSLHHNGPAQCPHYCGSRTDPSVDLPLHSSPTPEQDPEILKLLHLRQKLPCNLKRSRTMASDLEELIFIPASLHLAANRPSACCRSWLEEASRTTSSAKGREGVWSPNRLSASNANQTPAPRVSQANHSQ
ncbi:hypothetical protein AMECASPLE_036773, partial [Ameca splendens]